MFFRLEKLEKRVRFLEELRYSEMTDLFPISACEDVRGKDEVVQWPPVTGESFFVERNSFLTGRDRYYWLTKEAELPPMREGFECVGVFDMGKTGAGTNSGFESLLYLNEEMVQAVDSNHKEVFFREEDAGKKVKLQFLLWSGLEGGGEKTPQIIHIQQAAVGYLHKVTDEFYFLGKAIFKTVKVMEQTNPLREKLLAVLDQAFLEIDLSLEREEVYAQICEAYPKLREALVLLGEKTGVRVHCVGHTHIDVAWLWRLKHTKEKALRSFSTVLKYMEQYEDYRFVQSQPQLYAYVKETQPALYEKIKERVLEGRFEAEGAMWVEADCNLSSGEALVRQILEGSKFFMKEFGKSSTCLWLPDVFGYSVALPQILKLCGISRFVTTKISWNEYNKMPHDTFFWRGLDGSEVLTHFITTPEEGWPEGHKYSTYNGQISPRTVIGTWNKYEDKAVNQDLLISYGYGDGGGGPTRTMIMMRRAMDQIPGIPAVKSTSVKEYLDTVEHSLSSTGEYVHTWCGELYLENHRGTYTSQGYNKLMNRRLEYALKKSEMLGVFSFLDQGKYEAQRLENVWRILLLNQFHDIIPGSSIEEVYADSRKQYEEAFACLERVDEVHLSQVLTCKKNCFTIGNFTFFPRKEQIALDISGSGSGYFEDETGRRLKAQKTKEGYVVSAVLRPMGFTGITYVENVENVEKVENLKNMEDVEYVENVEDVAEAQVTGAFSYDSGNKELVTPFYKVKWDESGKIVRLYDRENDREVLSGFANRLTVYEDRPFNNDAWNIDIFHTEKYEEVTDLKRMCVVRNGSLQFSLQFEYCYRHSVIDQTVTFYSDSRRVDFETVADWHENHRLLKACFDVKVYSAEASYDIQFGNVKRPTHFNTSWDYAKFEVAAHKWIDLSETGYGVALLNNCKYGFSVRDSLMSISLIKCATFPDVAADQGIHRFTYSMLPHSGTWQEAGVQEESEALNHPAQVWEGAYQHTGRSLFRTDADHLSVDAVKRAEDGEGIILRFHEFQGKRGTFAITSDWQIHSYTPVNLLEEPLSENTVSEQSAAAKPMSEQHTGRPEVKELTGADIRDSIKPYEIKTYHIRLK